jgi:lipopolysaccharide transport protein LptA
MASFLRLTFIFAMLSLSAQAAYALNSDREQVLHASSSSAEINQQTGIAVYLDHVVAIQGTTTLLADKVITKQDKQHQLIEVIAYGNPAVYKTIPEVGKAELTATALEIHFFPQQHYVQLIQDAIVIQDGNRYAAPLINYNTETQTVNSPTSNQGHTTIVLMPNTFNKKPH